METDQKMDEDTQMCDAFSYAQEKQGDDSLSKLDILLMLWNAEAGRTESGSDYFSVLEENVGSWITEIKKAYAEDELSQTILKNQSKFTSIAVVDGVIFKISVGGGKVLYVPPNAKTTSDAGVPMTIREAILYEGHNTPYAGHLGTARMKHSLARYFYWPKMQQDIEQYVKGCQECRRSKARHHPKIENLHRSYLQKGVGQRYQWIL